MCKLLIQIEMRVHYESILKEGLATLQLIWFFFASQQ